MFIPPHSELLPPRLPRPEKSLGQHASGSVSPVSASLMPTERQSVQGVEVVHTSDKMGSNYPSLPHARIYHPKQSLRKILFSQSKLTVFSLDKSISGKSFSKTLMLFIYKLYI